MSPAITRLPIAPSPERLAVWRALIDAGDFAGFAEAVVVLHYDPAYARARRKHGRTTLETLGVVPADPESRARAAEAVARQAAALDAAAAGGDP